VSEAITFIKSFGLDDTFLGEMELVLMEAVTNTVKHTKGHSPERAAGYLEILISEDGVESRIEDGNVPYREKMTGDFPDVDSVGGRGFPIMELLMDEVKHIPLPEGNLLILTKKTIPVGGQPPYQQRTGANPSVGTRTNVASDSICFF